MHLSFSEEALNRHPMNTQSHLQKPTMTFSCSEKFDDMKENGMGRTCEQCDKTVYDFRGRSQGEINNIIRAHDGELCAIVPVNKINEPSRNISAWNGMRMLRRFALCIFMVFGAALFSFTSAYASGVARKVRALGYEQLKSDPENVFVVKGKVKNSTLNENFAMVSITLELDGVEVGGTITDYNGEFVLQTSELTKEDWENAKMKFTYMGYGTQEVDTFEFTSENYTYLQVEMAFEAIMIEGIEVNIEANVLGEFRTGSLTGVVIHEGIKRLDYFSFPDTDRSEDVTQYDDDF